MHDFEKFCDGPIADANGKGHKGARPYSGSRRSCAEDRLKFARVGEELVDVVRQEGAIAFAGDDKVADGLAEPAHHRGAVALMLVLLNEPRFGLGDLRLRVAERIVVYHHDFINDPGLKKSVDDSTDAPFLVIRRDDNAYYSTFIHGYKVPRTMWFWYVHVIDKMGET